MTILCKHPLGYNVPLHHVKQALTKAYSQHDLKLVGMPGISNKSEFNTAKMAQCTLILHGVNLDLTWHQAFMVNGHYTKYE